MALAEARDAVRPPTLPDSVPQPRTWPLFDPEAQPQSWNERLADGEFAVLYSGGVPVQTFKSSHDRSILSANPAICTVFSSLPEAEQHAREQTAAVPTLRCRIYDRQGFAAQPLQEFHGAAYKHESDLSPRFRRWVGCILFFGGLLLTGVDWLADFRYFWPSMLGTRMIPTGLVLLVIELGVQLNKWDNRRRARLSL